MLIQFIILIVGFAMLIKGADYFVEGASSIAKNLKVPDMLIALTIVAFGTSAPEAAVSIKAMLSGNSDMVLGNVFGSNILNILLILGISAIIAPLTVQKNTIKKEIPFLILVSLAMSILLMDIPFKNGAVNCFSRSDGLVILIFFVVFLYYLIGLARQGQQEEIKAKYTLKQAIIFTILGLIAIVFGGNFVVNSATNIAKAFGMSDRFIALTVVAFGTSLPELVTSILAAQKGQQDMALGNIIGSNIFNICFVAAFPAAVFGSIIPKEAVTLDLMVMILSTLLLYIFSRSEKRVSKKEGFIFLFVFGIYYAYLMFSQLIAGGL